LPYRLALFLLCISIGRTVGQTDQPADGILDQPDVAAAETTEESRRVSRPDPPNLWVTISVLSAVDDETATIVEGGELKVDDTEYEWKPFLQEFPNATCPNLQGVDRFTTLINYQCPGARSWYSCIDDLLELPQYRRYKCRPILFRWERHVVNRTSMPKQPSNEIAIRPEEVHMAQPNFIAALKERGRHGSNFCMLMLFYSPSCPFSARWAPYFNALPPRYTNILFVAVNASDPANGRMNSRLGIAGTPTMVLYVDGSPVARVDEQLSPSESLPRFIESLTDWHTDTPLLPNPDGNVQVEPSADRSYAWLVASLAVYVISSLYHFVGYTEKGRRWWAALGDRLVGDNQVEIR
ncbi:hypothetical protein PMAYCL1PPCAC_20362, partial [Pristionchus mayeri]